MKFSLFLFLVLSLISTVWAGAGLVTMQDTLWPTGDGVAFAWVDTSAGMDDWENLLEGTIYRLYTGVNDRLQAFVTMAACPGNWVWFPPDSVEFIITAKYDGTEGTGKIAFGRSENEEGFFVWCGDPDTCAPGVSYDTFSVMYNTTDPCPDGNWTAYSFNLDDYQWGFRALSIEFLKTLYVAEALVVGYWTFSDSAEILTSSAVLCSTWGVSGCDDLAECLGSQCCDVIISSTKDDIHAWTIQEYSNPEGTQIDSVEIRFTGMATDDNQDSLTVFYATKSGETCTRHGVDTIPNFYYYGDHGGAEHSVVYATCPATGVAWTVSDLTADSVGFGVSGLHNSIIAVSWFIAIIHYSEEEAEESQVIIIGAKDEENYHNPRFVCPDLGR